MVATDFTSFMSTRWTFTMKNAVRSPIKLVENRFQMTFVPSDLNFNLKNI